MFFFVEKYLFHKSFVSGQYLCSFFSTSITFTKKFRFCLFCFFSWSGSNDRSCERCNEAWFYAIQSVVRLCNDFLKLRDLFSFISSLVGQLSQKFR